MRGSRHALAALGHAPERLHEWGNRQRRIGCRDRKGGSGPGAASAADSLRGCGLQWGMPSSDHNWCSPGHYRDGNSCEVLAVGAAGIKPAVSVTSFAISHASVYLVSGDRHRTDGQGALLPSFEFRALVIVLSLTIKKG